jgi:hypothetical protein
MEEVENWIKKINGLPEDNILMIGDIADYLSPTQMGFGNQYEIELEDTIIQVWKKKYKDSLLINCENEKHQDVQPCYCRFMKFRQDYIDKCNIYINCDGCKVSHFLGIRYNCKTCLETNNMYDLCSECFKTKANQHEHQDFQEITTPWTLEQIQKAAGINQESSEEEEESSEEEENQEEESSNHDNILYWDPINSIIRFLSWIGSFIGF